ncbi:MAG: hypothetical protein JJU20_10725 [Opitutales bacterium]|nr:hypothetical protein [Opitutales bacterium]
MDDLKSRWMQLDRQIATWWRGDMKQATESEILDPEMNKVWFSEEEADKRKKPVEPTLLFLPFPYVSGAGSKEAFPEMYCWDSYFINWGLLHHKQTETVRKHLLNHLFLVLRFGMVLNGNRTYYTTRSQTPLLAQDVWRYYEHSKDTELLYFAYPLLKKQYTGYWDADHHRTPIGLTTNRDLGDPGLRPELAAEAEILDFTPIFGGDVRNCVPIMTNCALVAYTDVLAKIAERIGLKDEAEHWKKSSSTRKALINQYCWDPDRAFYFEYNYVTGQPLEHYSFCAYWTLWAGVADTAQAEALVAQLDRIECAHGVTITDRIYESPHPEFDWLQFQYPAGWPPMQMIIVEALKRYGYTNEAERIAEKFLRLMLRIYEETGELWEKYNVVDGSLELPIERYKTQPFHGWSSAAIADLGRTLFK